MISRQLIFLDGNATTPMDPRVRALRDQVEHEAFGNASSDNWSGRLARKAEEEGVERLANAMEASADEIVMTSGTTEAINLGIGGFLDAIPSHGRMHIVSSLMEHTAVIRLLYWLEEEGRIKLTLLRPDRYGEIKPEQVWEAMRPNTALVTLIHGNNELGTINDIGLAAKLAKERAPAARFLVDVSQTAAYGLPSMRDIPADMLVFGAHKMYGPNGIGCLYVRRGTPMKAVLRGGNQQRGFRPGTTNPPATAAMGLAAVLAAQEGEERARRIGAMRDLLWTELQRQVSQVRLNGHPNRRVPGNLSVVIPYVEAELVRRYASNIACSQGSACTSDEPGSSHVLRAIGLTKSEAVRTIRFGVCDFNTSEEMVQAAQDIGEAINRYSSDA